MEENMETLEKKLVSCSESEAMSISSKLSALYDQYVMKDGLTYKSRIESVLRGLGFGKSMWNMPICDLSGGQKTRLFLGKLILRQPDILILDEPTNHLDAESVDWLEDEIKAYKGTLIIISHDRYFLNAVTDKTLLIEDQRAYLYKAPYDKYADLRKKDLLYLERCRKQQQKQIAVIQAFIEKQRMWNRERNIIAAESRLKQLEKMTIIENPYSEDNTPVIRFEIERLGGKDVLEVKDLSFAYTGSELFSGLSFSVKRGERVFIQGPNGCGKSTLIKILTGILEPCGGEYKIGANIRYSYYAQDLSSLGGDNTVFDEVFTHANKGRGAVDLISAGKIRNALAAFGFKGDDVFKKVNDLSGGEKSRAALLKMTYDRSSLLFLDEPTNHLDIKTREVLENALSEFEGTVIAVSHDRYFTEKIATKIINMQEYCAANKEREKEKSKDRDKRPGGANIREERARERKREALARQLESKIESMYDEMDEIDKVIYRSQYEGDYELVNHFYDLKTELEKNIEKAISEYDSLS